MKKRNVLLTIAVIIALVILIILTGLVYRTIDNYNSSEKHLNSSLKFQEENENIEFEIDKITSFSSCNANIETTSNSSFTISDLYQYTDIAIFLKPTSENLTAKNTLKSVTLSNIEFSLKPSIGKPNLYYKNINDFAKPTFSKENLVENTINFETTHEDTLDYTKPILFNNCANPITLCYVNSDVVDTFTLENDVSTISYNGTLLKKCGITLSSISCKLNLTITIINNLDEEYSCPISINIPLSTENKTIYDGSLTLEEQNINYKFIRTN